MTFEALTIIEAELESAASHVGSERYRSAQDSRGRQGLELRDDVSKLIRGAIPILSAAITAWAGDASTAAGRKPTSLKPVTLIDPDVLAYLGLSRTFHTIGKGGAIIDISIAIGRGIEMELEAEDLSADPKRAKQFVALAQTTSRVSSKEAQHKRIADNLGVSLNWDRRRQMLVGDAVLGVLLTALSDIFERTVTITRAGTIPSIRITDEAYCALMEMTDSVAWLRPVLQPMATPPKPWTSYDTGCYHDPRLAKATPLIRTYSGEHKRRVRAAIADGTMAPVLEAVNAIQATRWAIDKRVLSAVKWAKEQGLRPSASFPISTLPELPQAPSGEEWEVMPTEQRSALSRSRKALKDIRATAAVNAGGFLGDTDTAEFLSELEAFYLPHSLDFRGRVYALPHFNHQRSDHLKALFRFADGLALGASGGEWLMVHLANCGDFEKVSKQPFAARVQWVRDNEGDILLCAYDPEGSYDIWSEADSPFCFLQACFEYADWMRSGFSEGFLSSIAVAADGSCSG